MYGLGKLSSQKRWVDAISKILHQRSGQDCDRDDLFFQDILGDIRTDQSASFGANFIIMDLRPSIYLQTSFYDLKESLCIYMKKLCEYLFAQRRWNWIYVYDVIGSTLRISWISSPSFLSDISIRRIHKCPKVPGDNKCFNVDYDILLFIINFIYHFKKV